MALSVTICQEYELSHKSHNDPSNANKLTTRSPQFCVNAEYIGDSISVYETLQEIFSSYTYRTDNFAKIIAEYASTQYMGCIECGELSGFIECNKDYKEEDGVQALKDENDNIRYYLNEIYDEIYDESELYDDTDTEMEILCVSCAATWKCSVCSLQTFPCYDIDDIALWQCNICKLMICDICCTYIEQQTICKRCYVENDNDTEYKNNRECKKNANSTQY